MNTAEEFLPLLGQEHSVSHVVQPQDTAAHWRNELDVLATPILLWLSEVASMELTDRALPTGWMSLGLKHDSQHLRPTPVRDTVMVSSRLSAIGKNQAIYKVSACDSSGLVFRGVHSRGLVVKEDFESQLRDHPGMS